MTPTIERFLARIATIEPEQARQMRVAWDAEDPEPRRTAWTVASERLRAAGRHAELDELRAAVNEWAGDKAFNFVDAVGGGSPEQIRQQARYQALPPVMDAGLASVAGDLLDQDQRYLLLKPMRAGMSGEAGRPRASGRSVRRPAPR